MKSKIYVFLLILSFLTPINSLAEHDCIDGREYGHKITVNKNLPEHWLTIGDKLINDKNLHSILRTKYSKYYTSGTNGEGFTTDHFCGFKNGIYITISNGDFGPSAEFSNEAPKCYPCKSVKETIPLLKPGSGLKIGQSKSTVSNLLGYNIKHDITSILFEEIEKGKKYRIWHSQGLRIEFRNNKLMRFSIDDYREVYDSIYQQNH